MIGIGSIPLDRDSRQPLYRQIVEGLRRRLEEGHLAPGVKLPSSRDLAGTLQVHRTTVTAAYRQLRQLGLVESGIGQGTFVAHRESKPVLPERPEGPMSWSGLLGSTGSRRTSLPFRAPGRRTVVMDRAVPDPALYPVDEIREHLAQLVAHAPGELFSYGPSAGDETLRKLIEERLARAGVQSSENEILIVGGSQQGIDLVARLLLREGGAVALDAPTYRGALEVFRLNGAEILGVPMTADGTDLDGMEALLRRRRVRLIYVMPTHQNPTGHTLDLAARHRLYEIARRAGVAILEDDWLFDLRRSDDPPPLKALDESGLVIHSGTFSKTAVPGFRVGWLSVPRALFPALVELKSHCDLSTGRMGQAILSRFIESGGYDRHVTRVREVYEKRLRHGLRALQKHFPSTLEWTRPLGGIVNWVHLPAGVDGEDVARGVRTRDVLVSPGDLYLGTRGERDGLRLCYSLATPARIERGIVTLAEVVEEIASGSGRGSPSAATPLV